MNEKTRIPFGNPEGIDKPGDFQGRVREWMLKCFGPEISADKMERNHRFLEESLELVQACGCTVSEAHQLVDYVFSRPVGQRYQEIGGVMVTCAALCDAHSYSMDDCGEIELHRIWTAIDKIRAKQAAKPKHSPLPETTVCRTCKGTKVLWTAIEDQGRYGHSEPCPDCTSTKF